MRAAEDIKYNGDNLYKKIYRDTQVFLESQKSLEKEAARRKNVDFDEGREFNYAAFCNDIVFLSSISKAEKNPIEATKYSKNYRNYIDGYYWRISIWLWPNGNVEVLNSRMHKKFLKARKRVLPVKNNGSG